jgi:hypothetical protein
MLSVNLSIAREVNVKNFSYSPATKKHRKTAVRDLSSRGKEIAMHTDHSEPSPLLIVPRGQSDAHVRLQQTLHESGIRVVIDRRSAAKTLHRLERGGERRAGSHREAALAAGKWVIVPAAAPVDVLDADARAILFLYCWQHSVPCEGCQDTYRLGWLPRTGTSLSCPRCGADLAVVVAAHARHCRNWAHRRKSLARIGGAAPRRRAAAG